MDVLLTVEGLFTGTPSPLPGAGRGVLSAIAKRRVAATEAHLGWTRLDGDRQADMVSHGGPDKAVYMYPSGNYDYWRSLGYDLAPGGVGENAPVTGQDEHDVRIGDVWEWGEARVQVSQPRSPCSKLAAHTGRKEITRHMIESGRTGWYLRVLQPGFVPVEGVLRLLSRDRSAPTVHELFSASYARDDDPGGLREMVDTPALAEQWRLSVQGRLARAVYR
ncbi:MOSC domain-containing protein [Spirillospora sp. CA-294931]|uniref:MOSC domain-containing protein n=1 Tax=Spirillospora sp. CA-294931 TaxID=3240042 RepID=UPI003D913521